jgi:hypothetical protein
MVISRNLSAYDGVPPAEGENRKIADGPLYELAKIQALTEQPDAVNLWTAKCIKDAAKLALDPSDLGGLIRELANNDYHDSEWCDNGKNFWAACDAYTLTRSEFNDYAGKSFRIVYFLKFAESKTGKLVLVVSCHTSN